MSLMTFQNGKFRITNPTEKLRSRLRKDAAWNRVPDSNSYETLHLRAAVAFRSLGNADTEKILRRVLQATYDLPWLPPLPFLDPHQRTGLEWILTRKRSYLAHAPGAGKTAQAILAARFKRGSGPSLFIVPPSLVMNWEREISQVGSWIDEWISLGVVQTSDRKERVAWGSDFIICPDSMLLRPWVYEKLLKIPFQFIAVDEASRFKEHDSLRSVLFYGGSLEGARYPGIFRKARHVVFLDGSPMPNRPIELWAPTFALDPESIDCRDRDDFGYRYCGARPNDRGVWEYLFSSNEEELRAKLRKRFMHVVTEEELSHPERLRSLVFTNEDVRTAEMKTWETRHLTSLLNQISESGEQASQGGAARMRREIGIRKVPWVAQYVLQRAESKDEQILIFAWHREVCFQLAEKLEKFHPGVIIGGTPAAIREEIFRDFQKGLRKVLILNIAAGGRGHNLQAASRVIFAEFSWTDELNKQCEKRASRRGSTKSFVRCEYVIAPGSMDEPVLRSVLTKEKRIRRIIG